MRSPLATTIPTTAIILNFLLLIIPLHLSHSLLIANTAFTHKTTSDTNNALDGLAQQIAKLFYVSGVSTDEDFEGATTGWKNWADQACVQELQTLIHSITTIQPSLPESSTATTQQQWKHWWKTCPTPFIVDLSQSIQQNVQQTLETYGTTTTTKSPYVVNATARVQCQILALPSGFSLDQPIRTPPGAMVFGTLLYGGVTRYRWLSQQQRRVGERRETSKSSWLQYGGPDRNYQAVDMGPCAIFEITLFPPGQEQGYAGLPAQHTTMWAEHTQNVLGLVQNTTTSGNSSTRNNEETISLLDQNSPQNWYRHAIGGLETQVQEIIRRVLSGRALDTASDLTALRALGLTPVRGLLLYGPPGCGKTALVRELARVLHTKEAPKIVAAPELLDRWVGGSERLIRELFVRDADPDALHIIAIDECDAVFRHRTASESSGEVARASAVNQLLALLDGMHQLGNVLVIGMTNRRELLDPALLRPGRLEVQIKIPKPDETGRREILQIHFGALRRNGRLSAPLCRALDGRVPTRWSWRRGDRDLASETVGWTGADLAGLVRCAASLALARARHDGLGVESLLITMNDVDGALAEMKKSRVEGGD